MLISAIITLSGAIGVLWRRLEKKNEHTEARLTDCEEDRADLWDVIRNTALAHMHGDKQAIKQAAEIATARLENKRLRPPSDRPADETIQVQ